MHFGEVGRMRLITVTRKIDGAKMYVNPELVCAVYPYNIVEDTTVIQFLEDYITVSESADSVANMIRTGEQNETNRCRQVGVHTQ